MEIEIKDLFGLPAHPLVVHAVVVLLPLTVIGCLLLAVVPRWRRPYGVIVLGGALLAVVSVMVAKGSGESLEERVPESELVERHAELADGLLPWTIVLAIVAAGIAAEPRVEDHPKAPARVITAGLVVAALVVGTGASWSLAKVGHSGAKAAWHDVDQRDAGGRDGRSG